MRTSLSRIAVGVSGGLALAVAAGVSPAWAELAPLGTTTSDPLHGFCWGSSSCADNGTNTPTKSDPPQFGFTISPGPQTGNLILDILIPNSEDSKPSSLSFTVTETNGGVNDNKTVTATATLVKSSAWGSGDLETYLGYKLGSGAPKNPLGAYLPSTDALVSTATGFYVYQVDLGQTTVLPTGTSNPGSGPEFSLSSSIAQGAYIVSYLGESGSYISTANSGAIFETSKPVPEPVAALLLATGLAGFMVRNRRQFGLARNRR